LENCFRSALLPPHPALRADLSESPTRAPRAAPDLPGKRGGELEDLLSDCLVLPTRRYAPTSPRGGEMNHSESPTRAPRAASDLPGKRGGELEDCFRTALLLPTRR
jgi:hypothetical protein